MPKIPGINHPHAVRALEKAGFRVLRQGKHVVMTDGQRRSRFYDPQAQPRQRDHHESERPGSGKEELS
ncbi:MAG: hypothetical protein OXK78_11760 [Caldilineaceae bacterium]|nr:hypothetical protein [Caldilineaceae bacterium]